MDDQKRRIDMAERLTQAGAAHGEYEATTLNGEYDKQWAEWYAVYLLAHHWNDLFSSSWNVSELAEALRQANTAHRAQAGGTRWQDFYAERFMAQE